MSNNSKTNLNEMLNSEENVRLAMDAYVSKNSNRASIHGVYSVEDLIRAEFRYDRYRDKKKTLEIEANWLTDARFNIGDWAESLGIQYYFDNPESVLFLSDDGFIQVYESRGKLQTKIAGDVSWCKQWQKYFEDNFKKAESLIQWVYNQKGDEIQIPLNFRKAIKSAYPWFENGYEAFIDSYLDSEASILILLGPPGVGKTTLIKNIIHRSKSNAKVAYDEAVLSNDGFFAGFIEDDARFLIMEDADNFLTKRSNGNSMMHRFLNVSDGLISAQDKKLIFSTNLPSTKDIDDALTRPGRCFDIVEFKPLTRQQAMAVISETGSGVLPENKDKITLAEIFSTQQEANKMKTRTMGFV